MNAWLTTDASSVSFGVFLTAFLSEVFFPSIKIAIKLSSYPVCMLMIWVFGGISDLDPVPNFFITAEIKAECLS